MDSEPEEVAVVPKRPSASKKSSTNASKKSGDASKNKAGDDASKKSAPKKRARTTANAGGGGGGGAVQHLIHASGAPPDGANRDCRFDVEITQPSVFRHLLQVIAQVIPECALRVVREPDFCGLVGRAFDDSKVCLVSVRFACNVLALASNDAQDAEFCFCTATMNTCLSTVSPSATLRLIRTRHDAAIYCSAHGEHGAAQDTEFRINTIATHEPPRGQLAQPHAYQVDVPLDTLRLLVRIAKELKAEELQLSVHEPRAAAAATVGAAVQHIFVQADIEGDAHVCKRFHSVLRPDAPPRDGGGVDDDNDDAAPSAEYLMQAMEESAAAFSPALQARLEERFRGRFASDYLGRFIKAMQHDRVSLSVGTLLTLRYPLGSDAQSHITFVLPDRAPDT